MATTLTLRQRFNLGRFLHGLGPEAGPVTLDRHRIYILPTRHGLMLGLVLVAILLGAINYDNSLAYLLVFMLISLAVVAILHTYRNLQGLVIEASRSVPVFAGTQAHYPILLHNPLAGTRYGLSLSLHGGNTVCIDLPGGAHLVELQRPTHRRGRLALGRITLSSQFPLGLFRAWSHIEPDTHCLVYPEPATQRGLPPGTPIDRGASGDRGLGHDDFASLRPYRSGDSLRHVHWKSVARGQPMQTKQFGGHHSEELWLSWDLLAPLPSEQRLQRLCRWVLEAETAGLSYGLKLPGQQLEPGFGSAQRRRALEMLALFGEAP